MSFAAIGQIVATQKRASPQPDGAQLGATGASAPALRSDAPTVAVALTRMGPVKAEDALASRLLSLGVKCSVKPMHCLAMPDGEAAPPGTMGSIHSRAVTSLLLHPDADVEAVRADALEQLRLFSTPAPANVIEGWLAELSVIVIKRADDDFAEGMRVAAYAGRLGRYPADVVRIALLEHHWRFWPAWSELAAVLDGINRFRSSLAVKLREMGEEQRAAAYPETKRIDYATARRIIAEAGIGDIPTSEAPE